MNVYARCGTGLCVGHVSGFCVELRFGMCCAWCLDTVQVTFTVVCSEGKCFLKFITGAKDFFGYVIFVYKVAFSKCSIVNVHFCLFSHIALYHGGTVLFL
jgi:hypothetical protein